MNKTVAFKNSWVQTRISLKLLQWERDFLQAGYIEKEFQSNRYIHYKYLFGNPEC